MIFRKRVATSGYFDPLHVGHIECFKLAKKLAGVGGKLIVILNNDRQLIKKKPRIFMPMEERRRIIEAIRYVDEVYISIDEDMSVNKSLCVVRPDIFAKGGDQFVDTIIEKDTCDELNIKIVDGLGKKIQASSDLIRKWEK